MQDLKLAGIFEIAAYRSFSHVLDKSIAFAYASANFAGTFDTVSEETGSYDLQMLVNPGIQASPILCTSLMNFLLRISDGLARGFLASAIGFWSSTL